MKRFSKLLAVVLAIAVIICPMTIFAETSTSSGTYKIELVDANTVQLTIGSTNGFIAYHATVGFNSDDAFQSNYTDATTGYKNGLKVISYTLKTAEENPNNKPAISASASGNSLTVIVMPTDMNNFDKYEEVVIGIRVADETTASLTKIQAADDGDGTIASDPTLLTFPAAGSDGVIDKNADDYNAANAVAAPHVHSFTNYVSNNDATCTEDGTKTATCDNGCGTTDTITDEGSALGHSFTNYVSNNDATCTKDGTKTATCDNGCGTTDTITDAGTMLDHSFTYTSNEDGTHTIGCADCDYSAQGTCDTEGTDGACSKCGYKAAPVSYIDLDFKLTNVGLTMANGFAIDFFVNPTKSSTYSQYTDVYVVYEKDRYDASGNVVETRIITVGPEDMVVNGGNYYYTLTGIQPQELGTTVRATIYGYKDGHLYTGKSTEYSVLRFASSKYKSASDAKTKTMYADMIVYGNTVQSYAAYNTANMISEAFTTLVGNDGWLSYVTTDARTLEQHQVNTDLPDKTMRIKSVGLTLSDKVYLDFTITDPSGSNTDTTPYYLDVSYTAGNGAEKHYQIDINGNKASIDKLNATDLSSVVTVVVKRRSDNVSVSNTFEYTVETYVAKNPTKLEGSLVALMKYADSVRNWAFN